MMSSLSSSPFPINTEANPSWEFTYSPSAASSSNGKEKKRNKKGRSTDDAQSKLSTDPQSMAARRRRHRISDRFKILKSLVPGGSKLDTVSMLEETIQYVKFLKAQIWFHHAMISSFTDINTADITDHPDFVAQLPANLSSLVLPDHNNFNHRQQVINNYDLGTNIDDNQVQAALRTDDQPGLADFWFHGDEKYLP